MKTQKLLVLVLIAFGLSACGKEEAKQSDTTSGITSSKGLFSPWARDDGQVVVDFSHAIFGSNPADFTVVGSSGICRTVIIITGSDDKGNMAVTGSNYVGTGTDPGCSSLNSLYTYTKSGAALSVCNVSTSTCHNYK